MLRFRDTSVLLTGGASGIGRATAVRLASEGARVFAVDRDSAGLAEMSEQAAGPGGVLTATTDLTDEDAVVATVAAASAALGGIDVLINVAGTHRTTPIETLQARDLRELFEVNLVGTALMCREVVPLLPSGGVIVNVASSAATHGNPAMTAYAASKGAVLAFSLSLAAELVGRGIRVVPISPGQVETPLSSAVSTTGLDQRYFARITSLMGQAQPDQIAATIAFAASADASYLTGAEIRVDGGSHI